MSEVFPCNRCLWLAKMADQSVTGQLRAQYTSEIQSHLRDDHSEYRSRHRMHLIEIILRADKVGRGAVEENLGSTWPPTVYAGRRPKA